MTTAATYRRRRLVLAASLSLLVIVTTSHLLAGPGSRSTGVATAVAADTPDPTIPRDQLDTMTPREIAVHELGDRPPIAPENLQPTTYRSLIQPYGFTLSSFNVLGSQHTAPSGDAPEYAPGRIRTEWAADLQESYGSSIVGLQEVQLDQVQALTRATGGRWEFWPGTALGAPGVPQSVMWDTTVWQATYRDSITIPFVGTSRPQPIVRLQHLATGREIYVLNIHNSPNDREAERDEATRIEIAAVNLLRSQDNLPVFLMGDFNETTEAFCKVTGQTDLEAAQGGSNNGTCNPPSAMRVDWIFGSPDAQFSGFRFDTSPAVRRITDHAVLKSAVSVP